MIKSIYTYKGKNITALVLTKLEHVVSLLAERSGDSFENCYISFIRSKAYCNLIDTETLLWSESAEFIIDDYCREEERSIASPS
jgi:hypothetical protein